MSYFIYCSVLRYFHVHPGNSPNANYMNSSICSPATQLVKRNTIYFLDPWLFFIHLPSLIQQCRQSVFGICFGFLLLLLFIIVCTMFWVFVWVYVLTSGSLPSDTKLRALQPSEPIQEKAPVALLRRTARITSRTSWSDPNIMAPVFSTQCGGDKERERDRTKGHD